MSYHSTASNEDDKMSSMLSTAPTKLIEAEKAFKRARDEIIALNRQLDELSRRYDKASKENRRSFRYSLRLRMAVTEGVRNMFYEYASAKADQITDLRCQVRNETEDDDFSEDFSEGDRVSFLAGPLLDAVDDNDDDMVLEEDDDDDDWEESMDLEADSESATDANDSV